MMPVVVVCFGCLSGDGDKIIRPSYYQIAKSTRCDRFMLHRLHLILYNISALLNSISAVEKFIIYNIILHFVGI